MYKKVITMTGWRRPEYTKQVINNLKRCIGFEKYILLPTIEPGYQEVLKTFDGLPNCNIVVNDTRLGCAANTLKALQRGFEISDFVIHIEDDTVPGIDSLKYFEWIYKTYKDEKEIFTATAYNRVKEIDPQKYFTVYRCPYFTGWMWGTWKDRFEEMSENWDFNAWDININRKIRGTRYEICPNLPRSQNIGEYLGTYTRPANWKICQYNTTWVNNIPNILDILSSNMLPLYYISNENMSYEINELPYFEMSSSMCIPECYTTEMIGMVGIIGVTGLYLFYRIQKK